MKLNILFSGDDRYTITIEQGDVQKFGASITVDLETLKELRARIDYIIRRECEIDLEKKVKEFNETKKDTPQNNDVWTEKDEENFNAINRILYSIEYPSYKCSEDCYHSKIVKLRSWYYNLMERMKKK